MPDRFRRNTLFQAGTCLGKALRMPVLAAITTAVCISHTYAAPADPITQNEQLQEARTENQARQDRLKQGKPDVEGLPSEPALPHTEGGTAFRITEIRIEGLLPEFSFLQKLTAPHRHTDMDLESLNELVHSMNKALIEHGYATSRLILPEQNIREGMLRLQLLVGRIGHIFYAEGSAKASFKNAFPSRSVDNGRRSALRRGYDQHGESIYRPRV